MVVSSLLSLHRTKRETQGEQGVFWRQAPIALAVWYEEWERLPGHLGIFTEIVQAESGTQEGIDDVGQAVLPGVFGLGHYRIRVSVRAHMRSKHQGLGLMEARIVSDLKRTIDRCVRLR